MTHTLNNSMAGFIPECNISFNGGDLSSDTGAILPLDFINSNLLLQPYADLPFRTKGNPAIRKIPTSL